MTKLKEVFGTNVFDRHDMKERLPRDVLFRLERHMETGEEITKEMADVIASAVSGWAQERGATHYTHWFQPMTGMTAEKHDSFLDFSGKALIKGEPDASSFPSGGMRATFEARGYTAWDPSVNMFIKEDTLCIPTIFCSYNGEAMDKKTPLLRSEEALDLQARRVLKALGKDTEHITATVGAEQEYFLVSKELYDRRMDLRFTGRTLTGAQPPKTQELDDHYFAVIEPQVKSFMAELDDQLWSLGILADTEHNEVAPAQHELAPIFTNANTAADHNQLIMEMMRKLAPKHGLACLLDEKPFAGINGSGKHINWSIATKEGENLLKPGRDPASNDIFLIFCASVISAVDLYQDLLRISVCGNGNDRRLGGSEAPPAIISVFLGDDITDVFERLASGEAPEKRRTTMLDMGAAVLPDVRQDTSDRNRTSPFAFTGSRFEFRMVGSSAAVSCPVYMINSMVADVLSGVADALEEGGDPGEIAARMYRQHKRIVFNGDNYTEEWVKEAQERGLCSFTSTPEAVEHFDDEKNKAMFLRQKVLTAEELAARKEIILEEYTKAVNIEVRTMQNMLVKQIIPAVIEYEGELLEIISMKKSAMPELNMGVECAILEKLALLTEQLQEAANKLAAAGSSQEQLASMEEARQYADALEEMIPQNKWPVPTYAELLF